MKRLRIKTIALLLLVTGLTSCGFDQGNNGTQVSVHIGGAQAQTALFFPSASPTSKRLASLLTLINTAQAVPIAKNYPHISLLSLQIQGQGQNSAAINDDYNDKRFNLALDGGLILTDTDTQINVPDDINLSFILTGYHNGTQIFTGRSTLSKQQLLESNIDLPIILFITLNSDIDARIEKTTADNAVTPCADKDGDTLCDTYEDLFFNAKGEPDIDNDGLINSEDNDADGDGALDGIEGLILSNGDFPLFIHANRTPIVAALSGHVTGGNRLILIPEISDLDINDTFSLSLCKPPPAHGSAVVNQAQLEYTPNAGFNGLDEFCYQVTDQGNARVQGLAKVTVTDNLNPSPNTSPDNVAPVAGPVLGSLRFQQGLNGYLGTQDAELRQNAPTAPQGSPVSVTIDGNDPVGAGTDVYALLRFDRLFGQAQGQIPASAVINKALLNLYVVNGGDSVDMLTMQSPWDETTATWDSLSGGIRLGRDATFIRRLNGRDVVTGNTGIFDVSGTAQSIDVTAEVKKWAEGAVNLGWVFMPSSLQASDGADFSTKEESLIERRPTLVLQYTRFPAQINTHTNVSRHFFVGGRDANNDALTVRIIALPNHGILYQADGRTEITLGDTVSDAQGAVVFTPALNFTGQTVLDYVVNDGVADSNTASITIHVKNTAPVAGLFEARTFQQGVGGYSGTQDAELREMAPDLNFDVGTGVGGNALSIDGDDAIGPIDNTQGLLRFDAIFGAGDTQIPLSSIILDASLKLHLTSGGDSIDLSQMQLDWAEKNVTWNSLIGGVDASDAKYLRQLKGLDMLGNGILKRTGVSPIVSVTPELQNWSNGESNFGWGFTPSFVSATDGVDFNTKTSSIINNRPRLSVNYLAMTSTVNASIGVNTVLHLNAVDADNDAISFKVTGLPANGVLFQADGVSVINVGDAITDFNHKVVFKGRAAGVGIFSFIANDGVSDSVPAIIRMKVLVDTDSDGLADIYETNTGLFISKTNAGTDPHNPDTDGDGVSDGDEVLIYSTNPMDAASMPMLATLGFGPKSLEFNWLAFTGADHYRLLVNPDGVSGFSVDVTAGSILAPATHYRMEIPVHQFDWSASQYIIQACRATLCTDSSILRAAPITNAVQSIAYIKASNTASGDHFGRAVALSDDGNTLVVAAPAENNNVSGINGNQTLNVAVNSGAVYVYRRDALSMLWQQEAYIKASNVDAFDDFGTSVALSADGNTLAVGAPGEKSNATGVNGQQNNNALSAAGAGYIFVRDALSGWHQQAYIKASNSDAFDRFAASLALSANGSVLLIGAAGEDGGTAGINGIENNALLDSGAAYLFIRTGSLWAEQAYIKASNAGVGDHFGQAVTMNSAGTALAVGAIGEDSGAIGVNAGNLAEADNSTNNAGAVYIYGQDLVTGLWGQKAYVKASNSDANDVFGGALVLSADGNTLGVGAVGEDSHALAVNSGAASEADNTRPDSGAAYVFSRDLLIGLWTQQAYIKASNTDAGDAFGGSLALTNSGNRLVIGATRESSVSKGLQGTQLDNTEFESGAVYLYSRAGGIWHQQRYIKAKNTQAGDQFAQSIGFSGDGSKLAIGADWEDGSAVGFNGNAGSNAAIDSGAVYLY